MIFKRRVTKEQGTQRFEKGLCAHRDEVLLEERTHCGNEIDHDTHLLKSLWWLSISSQIKPKSLCWPT